jgi:outer membrane lipoprotein-sorting protein
MKNGMGRMARGSRWVGLVIAIACCGCSRDPRALLDRMGEAYRAADRYRDDATVHIHYTRGDKEVDHDLPFRVAFERPDRLRVECYDAQLVSDGASLHAAVGDVPGQVLVEPVKSPLSLEQLFSDPHLRTRLSEGEAGCPTQLPLLLADDTVSLILAEAVGDPRIAGRGSVDGYACTKIEVDKPDGTLALWIDDASFVLRRMSLPTAAYAAFLSSQLGPVSRVEVVAEFKNASFDTPISGEAFSFEVPEGARNVSKIEPVQSPDPPAESIGKASPPFTLSSIDGDRVSRESLAGRVAVLEFFFEGCGPCSRSMPRVLEAVGKLRAAGRDVSHHRVSVDDAGVADETIRDFIGKAAGETKDDDKADSPTILRDPRSVAASAFEITTFPGLVVLAPDGTVADVQRGSNDRIGEDLFEVVEAVAAGKTTPELVRKRFDRRLSEYRSVIDAATGGGTAVLPEQVIAPKRQPERFKLLRAWKTDAVAMPGNVVRTDPSEGDSAEALRLFVLDGWRSVVELDAAGLEVARHDLELPADAAIGFLRTALDREGRRWWLGGAVGGQRLFVFDNRWRRHAVYPELGAASHAGVSGAELVDLDGVGGPEIVAGFFGSVGLHGVSLDGRRIWKERSLETVISLAADAAGEDGCRGVVVVDARGRLARIGPDGTAGSPVEVDGSRIQSIHAAPVGATGPAWALLAIAGESLGRTRLVGIAPLFAARWIHDLPDGIHRDGPIEPVAWIELPGDGSRQWLVAAPDGSVTVVRDDGGIVGSYAHGEPIVGLNGFVSDGVPHIVIATRTAVEALRMEDIAID